MPVVTQRLSRGVIAGPVIPGKTGVTLLARIRGGTGALINRASLSTITYTVSNVSLGTTLGTGSFTVSSSVYDSLQQSDPRWLLDSATEPGPDGSWGYNFAATLAATLFALTTLAAPGVIAGPARPQTIQADVVFTPTSGEAWRCIWRWQQEPTYG